MEKKELFKTERDVIGYLSEKKKKRIVPFCILSLSINCDFCYVKRDTLESFAPRKSFSWSFTAFEISSGSFKTLCGDKLQNINKQISHLYYMPLSKLHHVKR